MISSVGGMFKVLEKDWHPIFNFIASGCLEQAPSWEDFLQTYAEVIPQQEEQSLQASDPDIFEKLVRKAGLREGKKPLKGGLLALRTFPDWGCARSFKCL